MNIIYIVCGCGGMADAADSKSAARKGVRVQVPPSAFLGRGNYKKHDYSIEKNIHVFFCEKIYILKIVYA